MSPQRSRYLLIALLLALALNYPLLSAANKPLFVLGLPLLYLYIGVIWLLTVLLLYLNFLQSRNHE